MYDWFIATIVVNTYINIFQANNKQEHLRNLLQTARTLLKRICLGDPYLVSSRKFRKGWWRL